MKTHVEKNLSGEINAPLMLQLHNKWIDVLKKNLFKVDTSFKVSVNTSKHIDAVMHETEGKFLTFIVRVSRGNTQGKSKLVECIKRFLAAEGVIADMSHIGCVAGIDEGLLFKNCHDYVKTNTYTATVKLISGAWADNDESFRKYEPQILCVSR